MTEPLIDRDDLHNVIETALMTDRDAADFVVKYLRSVLTPEALATVELRPSSTQGVYYGERSKGADLHRRIFGEDK